MSSEVHAVAQRLHAAALHLLRMVRAADAQSGLTSPRLSVLSVLVFAGDRTITELASAEQVRPPTMTRLIDGLERDRYVKRRSDAKDSRVVHVRVTAKGRTTLQRARALRVAAVEQLLAPLPTEDLAVISRAAAILDRLLSE